MIEQFESPILDSRTSGIDKAIDKTKGLIGDCFNEMDEIILCAMAAGLSADRIIVRHPSMKWSPNQTFTIEGYVGFVPEGMKMITPDYQ